MRSSSRMPPSFLLLLERAPKPDAKITRTFSLSIFSRLFKAKAVREERDVIYFCADGLKFCFFFKESNGFFFLSFFLSRRKIFSRFFQSDMSEGSSQLISLLFFFSSTDLYSHTQSSIPAKHCVRFLRARKRDKERNNRML